jgi:hypothetical protein
MFSRDNPICIYPAGGYVHATAATLVLEIGIDALAVFVRSGENNRITAFEYLPATDNPLSWDLRMDDWIPKSQLLDKHFASTHVYFRNPEALLIPGSQYKSSTAETYMDLSFGPGNGKLQRHSHVGAFADMELVYRIPAVLHEWLNRYHPLYQPQHSYLPVLREILQQQDQSKYIRIDFTDRSMQVVVSEHTVPLLLRHFDYASPEDAWYWIEHVIQQYAFNSTDSNAVISGAFETGSLLHEKLQSRFGLISFDRSADGDVFELAAGYPSHCFARFSKMAL